MTIRCRLFGHRPDPNLYGNVTHYGIDGIGREHAIVKMRCVRCDDNHTVGMLHLPERDSERELWKRFRELEALGQKSVTDYYDGLFLK